MPTYMKAYRLEDLRRSPVFHEDRWNAAGGDLDDDDIVYVHESLVVTRDVFGDDDVIFDDVTDAWKTFCRDELRFQTPDWDAEAARAREALAEQMAAMEKAATE